MCCYFCLCGAVIIIPVSLLVSSGYRSPLRSQPSHMSPLEGDIVWGRP